MALTEEVLAIEDARIWTGDPANPRAEAMLVRGDRIVAVGPKEIAAGAHRRLPLEGRMVMPGVIDVHNHALEGGRVQLYDLTLSPTASFGAILDTVGRAAPNHEGWLVGHGWGQAAVGPMLDGTGLASLDALTGPVPTVLRDISYHSRFANSAALRLAGIVDDISDPANGTIVRDPASGRPTGLLHETAGSLVDDALPAYSSATNRTAVLQAIATLNSFGVTGLGHAVASRATLEAFDAVDLEGRLSAYAAMFLDSGSVLSIERDGIGPGLIESRRQFSSPHVLVNFAKYFMDGVPSMRTSAFFEDYLPFEGEAAGNAEPFYTADELARLIAPLDRAGIRVKVHAIGDRAIADVMDAVAAVRAANGPGPTHQIAHMNFIRARDIARMAQLNIAADLCPPMWFPTPAQARIRNILGDERVDGSWPIRDLVESGVLAAAGTDWPCVSTSPNPWPGLSAMVTRKNPAMPDGNAHRPDQGLDVSSALRLYTLNPALALGIADRTGSLEVGKSADFIVLDRDLFSIPAEEIAATQVDQTWFEGNRVFART